MNDQSTFSDVIARLGIGPDGRGAPQTAAARTLDSLRRRIISLQLPPDTVLTRNELAREYGVSQTPLRDALQKLETEGLVDIFPQSKTLVTRINPDEIEEAHFLRRSVEIEVVRKLATEGVGENTLTRLKTLVSMQEMVVANGDDIGAFQDIDDAFHQALLSAAGYGGLHLLIRSRSGHLNRLRRLDMWDEEKVTRIIREHREIIAKLDGGDAEGAVAAVRQHLSQTITRLDRLRAAHPTYFPE
ncbi:MAG: GntR family transcriptional regulator [Vannielia sp.]|uniref:GntR family transcriptional regulator n=1 Tax=Rhodobacterales TaxID=204455 RepID=UPI00209607F7|nr:GntR family transcriptional regulator [Oceanicola sp. 502str15]MCO6384719.1 FCD domain-containing protein [Oceanicola sp. 502str15]